MAERIELRSQVLDLARQELELSAEELERIDDSADLGQHLDSLQVLQLVVAIEDHFKICFEPEDDDASTTLAEVVRVVEQRLAQR
jgi:acyl carrier protein